MIRPVTRDLIECVLLDVWPNIAAIVDFGIINQEIYNAYHHKIRHEEVTAEQLDEALGSGPKLTELMGIKIETAYDFFEIEDAYNFFEKEV